MKSSQKQFKNQLMHLRQQFHSYLTHNNVKKVPTKQAVVMTQKYIQMDPQTMLTWFSKSSAQSNDDFMTWDNVLECLSNELGLRDQVNKLAYSKSSIIDITYHREPDSQLQGQKIQDLINQVKKKQTNIIRNTEKLSLLGYKLIVVALDNQLIFYDCKGGNKETQDKEIGVLGRISFKYCNVKNKMLTNQKKGVKANSSFKYTQYADKVNPMSRRTDEAAVISNKYTQNSDSVRNALNIPGRKNRLQSSFYSEQSNKPVKRSQTDSGLASRSITRSITRLYKWNSSHTKNKKSNSMMTKIRSNDNKAAFQIISQASTPNAIQFIKVYRNSQQNFQKYVTIQKHKIEKEQSENYKVPSSIQIKQNFSVQLKGMKQQSLDLSTKKRQIQKTLPMNLQNQGDKYRKIKSRSAFRPKQSQHINQNNNGLKNMFIQQSDACKMLQQKVLPIQSFCFAEQYLVVSLINRQVRLYKFRQTIYSFKEYLIFQEIFDSIVSYVTLYKSETRKLYNLVIAKLTQDHRSQLIVFQLNGEMHIQNQCFRSYVNFAPIFKNINSLGIFGYVQNGYFFLLEFNSIGKTQKECITLETNLCNPQNGQKLSIGSIAIHRNQMHIYFGSKNGLIYVFDRFTQLICRYKRLTKFPIKFLDFVGNSHQIIFCDDRGKIGIANTETLNVQTLIMSGNTSFNSIIPFFIENFYLMFSGRSVAAIELNQNQQKQFIVQKPLKIYNRRKKLQESKAKNKNKRSTISKTQIKQNYHKKVVLQYFVSDRSLILICSSCQIMIYDEKLEYAGSYFTLEVQMIVQCKMCSAQKYLGILDENNQIQIVNYYTQSIIIKQYQQEQIQQIFFCDSSIYFFGYITQQKKIRILGYPNSRVNKGKNGLQINSIQLKNIIFDIFQVQYQIKFYQGSMIYVDMTNGIIVFFNKKIFNRSHSFNCWDQVQMKSAYEEKIKVQNLSKEKRRYKKSGQFTNETFIKNILSMCYQRKSRKIVQINRYESGLLSIMRIDGTVIIYCLQKKKIVMKNNFLQILLNSKHNTNELYEPWMHNYSPIHSSLVIIWKIVSDSQKDKIKTLVYTKYQFSIKDQEKLSRNQLENLNQTDIILNQKNQFAKYQILLTRVKQIWSQNFQKMQQTDFTKKKFVLLGQNFFYFNLEDKCSFRGLHGPQISKQEQIVINTQQL